MATLAQLFVELKLSAESFNNDIKQAQREAKEFEKSFKATKELVGDVGKAMTIAGAAIVGTMGAMVKATADYGDSLNDARQRTGIAVESLARLGFAAEQSGSSFEGMSTGLKFLAKNMEAAADGGKAQKKAFDALGISVKNAAGEMKPTSAVLLEVADRFANMADGSAKSAIAMQVFGRSGADLIPTLNAGSAGLEAMGDAAERAGLVISDQTARASDEFNDRLLELQAGVKGISIAIGSVLLPVLTDFFSKAMNVIVTVRQWAAEHPNLIKAVAALGAALTGGGGLLLGLTGLLTILPKLKVALAILTGPIGLTTAAIAALVAGVIYFRKEIAIGLTAALATIVIGFERMIGAASVVARAIGADGLSSTFEDAHQAVQGFRKGLDELVVAGMAELGTVARITPAIKEVTSATEEYTFVLAENTEEADKAVKKAAELRAEVSKMQADLEFAGKMAFFKNSADDVKELHQELKATNERALGPILENLERFKRGMESWKDASRDATKQVLADLDVNTKATVGEIIKTHETAKKEAEKQREAQQKAYDTLFNSVKGTASRTFLEIFKDGEFHFSALGDTIKGVFATLANEILSTMTAKLITPLVSKITDALSGLLGHIPGLGGVLSGGASGAAGAASGAIGAVNTATGAASSGIGAAGSLTTGLLGSIAGGVISGLGSFLGSMRLEGTMNAVEENTRYTAIQLKDTMEQILWPIHNLTSFIAEQARVLGHELIPEIAYWGQLQLDVAWLTTEKLVTNLNTGISAVANAIHQLSASITSAVGNMQQMAIQQAQAQVNSIVSQVTRAGTPYAPVMSLPAYAEGVASVPSDQVAQVHEGERIISKDDNASLINLLRDIRDGIRSGQVIVMDGMKVGSVLNNAVKFGSMELTASTVKR